MSVMDIPVLIYHKAVTIFGTVVVVCFLIAVIVLIIERCGLSSKIRKAERGKARRRERQEKSGNENIPVPENIAVITGASSGLGANYARQIAEHPEKYGASGIWLIARRRERLEKLAAELSIPTRILPLDLTKPEDLERYKAALQDEKNENEGFSIALLANCAGFGRYGSSEEVGHEEECRMIEINDNAAIAMTDISVDYMGPGSRIIEVCSVAGFQPIPYFNAYAASKALLYSYSRSLHIELLPKGISVTAVCPYWIKDTEFIEKAAGEKRKLFLTAKSKNVAKRSLYAARHHHALSTPSIVSFLDRIFSGLIPDELLGYLMTRFL